jgi:hypothetical protein
VVRLPAADRRWRAAAWAAVLVTGAAWASLSGLLAIHGHTPSGPTPFGEHHHTVQSVVVVPLLSLVVWLAGRVASRGTRAMGGALTLAGGRSVVAFGLSVGLGLGLVLPELIALTTGGLARLLAVAPFSGAVALALLFATQAVLVYRWGSLNGARAAGVALSLVVAEGVLLGLVIR